MDSFTDAMKGIFWSPLPYPPFTDTAWARTFGVHQVMKDALDLAYMEGWKDCAIIYTIALIIVYLVRKAIVEKQSKKGSENVAA